MIAATLSADGQCLDVRGSLVVEDTASLLAGVAKYAGVTHVDLQGVDRVDSSALCVLLALSRAAHGATVTVHHAPPALRALSDLYGLQTLFWVV